MTVEKKDKAIFHDVRGSHVKLFGVRPERIHVPNFKVHEVFMTLNRKNVVRGLHFQINPSQPKLLSCVTGSALIKVVCLDELSENFLKVTTECFTGDVDIESGQSFLHIPEKHALGYRCLEDDTRMLYLAGSDFNSEGDVGINPFDADLNLNWGKDFSKEDAVLSERDKNLPSLKEYLKDIDVR